MIGPHEGKELELMLSGEKPLAMFHDAIPDSGEIPEDTIPEQLFAPYVAAGKIKRFSEDIILIKDGSVSRCVCFTLPGQEWRAHFLLWYTKQLFSKQMKYDDGQEYIIGGLLGYSANDVKIFIEHKRKFI